MRRASRSEIFLHFMRFFPLNKINYFSILWTSVTETELLGSLKGPVAWCCPLQISIFLSFQRWIVEKPLTLHLDSSGSCGSAVVPVDCFTFVLATMGDVCFGYQQAMVMGAVAAVDMNNTIARVWRQELIVALSVGTVEPAESQARLSNVGMAEDVEVLAAKHILVCADWSSSSVVWERKSRLNEYSLEEILLWILQVKSHVRMDIIPFSFFYFIFLSCSFSLPFPFLLQCQLQLLVCKDSVFSLPVLGLLPPGLTLSHIHFCNCVKIPLTRDHDVLVGFCLAVWVASLDRNLSSVEVVPARVRSQSMLKNPNLSALFAWRLLLLQNSPPNGFVACVGDRLAIKEPCYVRERVALNTTTHR